jgi:calcineurin-like phosphoesterase family protein
MATYFCSDPHAFHGNIMKHCRRIAFMTDADREALLTLEAAGTDTRSLRVSDESINNMNRGLADRINSRVGSNDVLWCLGDWVYGRGHEYYQNARWFRDQIKCRTIFFVWGNHDDRRIRDLFTATYDQIELREGDVSIVLNHYPMLTWNGQHHGSVTNPSIHLYGHVHAIYQTDPEQCPIKYPDAWAALDVGFDGHDYHVWSLPEILDRLRPRLAALEALKEERGQFDPFRGRGHRGTPALQISPPSPSEIRPSGPTEP